MSRKSDIHVTPRPKGGWQTIREGASRAGSRHDTQLKAISHGRDLAKRDKGEACDSPQGRQRPRQR